jgi:RHS repeat-associated protein
VTFAYDQAGRLRSATAGPDGTPQWSQQYGYDPFGNRSEVTAIGVAPDGNPMPPDGLSGLEYGRLRPDGLWRIDNRISTAGYAYDEAGNLTRAQRPDGSWHRYRYDSAGRLVTVTDDTGTPLESFTYGACRQRLETRDHQSGEVICHVWSGDQEVAAYRARKALMSWTRSSIHLGARLLCTFDLAQRKTGAHELVRYHHPDDLGTGLITSPGVADTLELATLPYGTLLRPSQQGDGTPTFTSYVRSSTTGLDYAVNRDYSAHLGRFLQPDPLGQAAMQAGDPATTNAYSYCRGDPVNLRDPNGLRWKTSTGCVSVDGGPWHCVTYVDYVDDDNWASTGAERLYGERRERPEVLADRLRGDNRAYDRLIRPWQGSGPRPTTWLDIIFGGYLLAVGTLLTAGMIGIGGGVGLGVSGVGAAGTVGASSLPPLVPGAVWSATIQTTAGSIPITASVSEATLIGAGATGSAVVLNNVAVNYAPGLANLTNQLGPRQMLQIFNAIIRHIATTTNYTYLKVDMFRVSGANPGREIHELYKLAGYR